MSFSKFHIPYQQTGYFSNLVTEYLNEGEDLLPFYTHKPNLEGIKSAIKSREYFKVDRKLLVNELQRGYEGVSLSNKLKENIDLLLNENTYTVCTAHQPNLFTGHLYFIYKILHAVKLAEELNSSIPDSRFVPLFFMGSEDADLAELGEVEVDGKSYRWQTKQTGAVGRMLVDDALLDLIKQMEGQLGVLPYGIQVIQLLKEAYQKGRTIEKATLYMVNALVGHLGVIVLLPDSDGFKKSFSSVLKKELNEQFSAAAINDTLKAFPQRFKTQTVGRDINLFYLDEQLRSRIERDGNDYRVVDTSISFSGNEIFQLLEDRPICFSPNVILRPVLQEFILPNVAFIGGGGELAYWLELKGVFEKAQVPYPVLILRNSFLLVPKRWTEKLTEWNLGPEALFFTKEYLLNRLVKEKLKQDLSLSKEISVIEKIFDGIVPLAVQQDHSLLHHVPALKQQIIKKMLALEKKIYRAARKRENVLVNQVETMHNILFPNKQLQERVDNIFPYYARWGADIINELLEMSPLLSNSSFTIILEKK